MQDFLAKSRANRDELVTLVPPAQVQRGMVDFRGKKRLKEAAFLLFPLLCLFVFPEQFESTMQTDQPFTCK